MSEEQKVKVGVGVFVVKDGKVLLGKRKNAHGANEYGGPGGHLEYGETAEQTALREIAEECGIKVTNLRLLCVSDLLKYFPKHYVDFGFAADWEAGDPQVLEPEKLESWDWYDLENLPDNLFGCFTAYAESYKTGKTYFTFPNRTADNSASD
ncbi:MAG: NUDIX domain-containing protein [Candidatus Saccharimonadales bacterium]